MPNAIPYWAEEDDKKCMTDALAALSSEPVPRVPGLLRLNNRPIFRQHNTDDCIEETEEKGHSDEGQCHPCSANVDMPLSA